MARSLLEKFKSRAGFSTLARYPGRTIKNMSRRLVVQLARFGDLIQAKRLVLSLQAGGAEVHLCVDESLAGLARLVYPRSVVHGIRAHKGDADQAEVIRHNRRIFGDLADLDFSRVYNLNFSGLNFALSAMFDPGLVRGYRQVSGQPIKDPWTEMGFRLAGNRRFAPLNLTDFWGHFASAPVSPDKVNPKASPGGGGLGVVLAGRHSRRSLPPRVLVPIIGAALQGLACGNVVLLGSRAERALAKDLVGRLPGALAGLTVNMVGKTGWEDLISLLTGLDAVITPDTGTMHLAAHLGVPVWGFFLSSAWCFETGPYGPGHTVWQAIGDCSPCLESGPCHMDIECLRPFADQGFLSALARGENEVPDGLVRLQTRLDSLGTAYVPAAGHDPYAAQRSAYRALVAEYLGLDTGAASDFDPAERLYLERDWMLTRAGAD